MRCFPRVSRSSGCTLALWTYAATLTKPLGLTACAAFLAEATGAIEAAFRACLPKFCRPVALKRGMQHVDLDARFCLGPPLWWVIALLRPRDLVLALDLTLCRDRLAHCGRLWLRCPGCREGFAR